MTKLKILIVFPIFFSVSLMVKGRDFPPNKSDWPLVEIRLSPKGTLKDIFDSGLRPYRFPSLESSMLEVKHVKAVVVQPNGFKLPVYEAQTITMHPVTGGMLLDMEFQNPRRNLEDSRVEMMRWIHLGNLPKRTEVELDEFLAAVKEDPIMYNRLGGGFTHNFAIRWQDENKIDYNVWFHQIANVEKPLAVFMKIGFPLTPRESDSYSIPIPPPPGYEHVDMTAPKHFGPDPMPRNPNQEEATIMPDPFPPYARDVRPPPSSYNSVRRPAPDEPEKANQRPVMLWWLVGAVAFVGIFLMVNSIAKK
jgi:hypothetical protein